MGRHKEWRKEAKKIRRKRIRKSKAEERDGKANAELELLEHSPRYCQMMAEQQALDIYQQEEESRQEVLRHSQWLENEEIAQKLFIARKERQAIARIEKIKQDKLIKKEWEAEQVLLKAVEDEKKRIEEEKQRKQEELMQQIEDFVKKGGELPAAANITTETHPDKEPCPFFSKTGACRFGDRCSRNHKRPGISKVLLIPSFYSHFGMSQSMAVEYDTDLMLEYEDAETYGDFKEFYNDVLPEFEEYGDVVQFKVCCNGEPHLRGNVYVEFTNERYALKAYRKFHGRFYGGRQLNVEFTCVASWKAALCGMFSKRRCPKGRNCNFLHVFRNPDNRFVNADRDIPASRFSQHRRAHSPASSSFDTPLRDRSRRDATHEGRGHWRWSESPPPHMHNGKDKTSRSRDSPPRRDRHYSRSDRSESVRSRCGNMEGSKSKSSSHRSGSGSSRRNQSSKRKSRSRS